MGKIIPVTCCMLLSSMLLFSYRSGSLQVDKLFHGNKLKVATGQFPVSGDVHKNARFIKKSQPILITPVARRKFDGKGHIQETHEPYSGFVRNIAQEYKVPLIDLNKKSQQLLEELGPEKSKFLFNYLSPGENPHFPGGNEDDTHFNELGARRIAETVLAEIKTLKLELADRIIKMQHK